MLTKKINKSNLENNIIHISKDISKKRGGFRSGSGRPKGQGK